MGISIPKGSKSGIYYYEFVVAGQRFKGSTETAKRRDAERIERDLKAEAKTKARAVKTGVKQPMTLLEAITAYTESKGRAPARDPNAAKEDREFERIIDRLGGPDVLMRDITTPVLDRLVKQRVKDFRHDKPDLGRVSGATVNRTTWQLYKRVYLHARDVEQELLPPIKWASLAVKEAGPRTRELKLEEEGRFDEHLREGYGAAYRFGLLSGLRCGNLVELRWSEVDLANREIRVVQKGEKEHTIAIDDLMMTILLAERGRHPEQVFTYVAQSMTQKVHFRARRRRPSWIAARVTNAVIVSASVS